MTRFLQVLLMVALSLQGVALSVMAPALAEEKPAQADAPSTEAVEGKNDGAAVQKRTIKGPSEEEVEVTLRKQLVYGLTVFDGGQYQGTFCPEEIDTIYMVANVDNVIAARKTDVYFWPITKEYMANWMETNEKQEGTLEILKGNKLISTLPLEKYVLRYPEGYMGKATELKGGKDAESTAENYAALVNAYYKSVTKYYKEYDEYSKLLARFMKDPEAFGNNPPAEPKQPSPPREYVTDLDEAFIVNLPPGVYRIRLKDKDGNVVPKSERKLVTFPALATGIGYEIIPEDKWTYPTNSDDLGQNIFVLKTQVIYLKPFAEVQYNSHHYIKLTQLTSPSSGRGMENQKIWVHVSPIQEEGHYIEIVKDGKVLSRVQEKPYYVKQRPGYALGYDIVEFDEKEHAGASPSFTAYKIEMPRDAGRYYLHLVDDTSKVVEGSLRSLRTVQQPRFIELLVVALLPLVAGIVVMGIRVFTTIRIPSRRGVVA